MKDRILQIMEREGLTPARFAEEIGIQRSAMQHILAQRNNPSLGMVVRVIERFPYIDTDWLLFGKGNMVKEGSVAEPDLFSAAKQIYAPHRAPAMEPADRTEAPLPANNLPLPVKEIIAQVEKPPRRVTKIVVFYSDNQFDTFVSETN